MADNVADENALATFMTNIYTELFVSSPSNPNAPINTTQHMRKEFLMDDKNINVVPFKFTSNGSKIIFNENE